MQRVLFGRSDNFLKDQDRILRGDGGVDSGKRLICIRVTNIETGKKFC